MMTTGWERQDCGIQCKRKKGKCRLEGVWQSNPGDKPSGVKHAANGPGPA